MAATAATAHAGPVIVGRVLAGGVLAGSVLACVVLAGCAGGGTSGQEPDAGDDATPLELALPATGGEALGSCLPFTVEYLAELSPAFAGTVTQVGDDAVVLTVDRWYAGDEAAQVVLTMPPGAHPALLGDIDFRVGGEYLITAVDGAVNLCGYSGEATADLEAAYEAAF